MSSVTQRIIKRFVQRFLQTIKVKVKFIGIGHLKQPRLTKVLHRLSITTNKIITRCLDLARHEGQRVEMSPEE